MLSESREADDAIQFSERNGSAMAVL